MATYDIKTITLPNGDVCRLPSGGEQQNCFSGITNDTLNLRETAGTGTILVVMPAKSNLAIYDTVDVNGTPWYHVYYFDGEMTGYCQASFVDTLADFGNVAKLSTNASTSNYLRGDGTWVTPPNDNTKNTAGSTDSSSKLFLIGATSQSANPQTYSHDTAYVGTDGCLYSNSTKVKTVQSAKTDPTASGTGITYITTLSQDANGVVTATKSTVRSASASQSGVMSSTHYSKLEGIATGATKNTMGGTFRDTAWASSASVASGTWTAKGNFTLAAGYHICVFYVNWASATSGKAYRSCVSTTSAAENAAKGVIIPTTGVATRYCQTVILHPTASTKYYFNVQQNSGAAVNCSVYFEVISIT